MKWRIAALWAGWALAGAFAADKPAVLPEASTILDRYVEVTGGRAVYGGYAFVTIHESVMRGGKTSYVTIYRSRDGRTRTETEAGDSTRESGVADSVAWEFSEAQGARILEGRRSERALANARGLGEDDWRARFRAAKTTGVEQVKGKACYRIQLTRTDESTLERFYDRQSGLLVREISTELDETGAEQPVTTDVVEYETSLGIKHPSLLEVKMPNEAYTIRVDSLSYSALPSRNAFEMPHEVARALAARRNGGSLPNAVDLVDKFIEVTGGRSAYEGIKTESMRAEVSLKGQNLKFPVVIYAAGRKMYASFDFPSIGKFEFGSDGRTGWQRSVVLGPRLEPQSSVGGLFGPDASDVLRWTDAGNLETVSKQEVNGSPCYLVRMGEGTEAASTACFDAQTGYVVKTSITVKSEGVTSTVETVLSDYRVDGGLRVAHHLETKVAGQLAEIEVTGLEINGPLPEGIFELPPDVRALVEKRKSQSKSAEDDTERPTLRRKK